ncbi:MAG: alpha/beta fold hydrolase [Chloroflexi bacterium]|nr:alpha/beta fold hydrolase [Chloroflexota bacterium]MDA1227914.1 alpha/beta fold hydrolase [Chloroflexota bacterium]
MNQELTSEDQFFEAEDGARLAYYVWNRQAPSKCRALVLILHGIGFHARPYKVVAESSEVLGATFAALDLRGHGRSGGPIGEMPPAARVLQDIEDWIEHLQASFLGVPIFLIAESMSGPYGMLYALDHPGGVDGLILVTPAVVPGWRQTLMGDSLSDLVSLALAPSRPSIDLSGPRLRMGSNDAVFPELRISDPDAMQSVSPRYLSRIGETVGRLMVRRSLTTKTPVLILHGERDKILSPVGSRILYHRLKSPDKSLLILPGANHTLFWDQSSHAIFSVISNWISGRIR